MSQPPQILTYAPPAYTRIIPKEAFVGEPAPIDLRDFIRAGAKVLHIGSGRGAQTLVAAQVVGSEGCVIGLELKQATLRVAQEVAIITCLRMGFRNLDLRELTSGKEWLPSDIKQFDFIISDYSTFCIVINNNVWSMEDIASFLSPGGSLLILINSSRGDEAINKCRIQIEMIFNGRKSCRTRAIPSIVEKNISGLYMTNEQNE
jgi:ubiquinone/menaquinone biosynthesis C-methylase UbiE